MSEHDRVTSDTDIPMTVQQLAMRQAAVCLLLSLPEEAMSEAKERLVEIFEFWTGRIS